MLSQECFRVVSPSTKRLVPLVCQAGDYGRNCRKCDLAVCRLQVVFNADSRRNKGGRPHIHGPKTPRYGEERIRAARVKLLAVAYASLECRGISPLKWLPSKGECTTRKNDRRIVFGKLRRLRSLAVVDKVG
jgi:hypothetical protein